MRIKERSEEVTSHTASQPRVNRSFAVSVRNTRSRPKTGEVSSNGVIGSWTGGKKLDMSPALAKSL